MHEISLCQGIVDIVRNAQIKHGFSYARRIRIEIGALSCVDPEALRFGFIPASAGTPAEGAELLIEEPPGTAWCIDCATSVTLSKRGDPCPFCGNFKLMIQGGDEMRVKDMEVI